MVARIVDLLSLGRLDLGPPPGQWRKEATAIHRDEQLFMDILVPVNGEESGWFALEQAMVVAQRENAHMLGLHVTANEVLKESEAARAVQVEFNRRCAEKGVPGQLAITSGEVSRQIATLARLTDVVITSLVYPPPPSALARLDSGFRDLIQRCPRPVLAVPLVASPLTRALLAYDGSPKADEALFLATYLAGRWKIDLTVLTVYENEVAASDPILHARHYLEEKQVEANYLVERGSPAEKIIKVAEDHNSNLLVMGGYGFNPVWEVVLGSVVDEVLRKSHVPVLICR
jgi:nucleotide-binding universal stress UspA family protein